jgi:uncharacterized damage-inducible protein DinB
MRAPSIRPLDEARDLVKYNRSVFDQFVRRVARRSWREATRNREIGHRTLFQTLVHILNVQEVWLVYIVRGRARELPALFALEERHPTTWKGFRAYSAAVWRGIDQTLANLSDRDFGRRVKAPWMPGRYTVRDAFFQTTFEEAHHLGEVIGALWQDDVASTRMTWIEVCRATPTRRRR